MLGLGLFMIGSMPREIVSVVCGQSQLTMDPEKCVSFSL